MRIAMLCALLILCGGAELLAQGARATPATPTTRTGRNIDDYDVMPAELDLTGEQLVAFRKAVEDRNRGYEAYLKTESGRKYTQAKERLAAAQAAGDKAKVARIEEELEPLRAAEQAERARLRTQFNKVLTLDQQRAWAGYKLYGDLQDTLRGKGLTDRQRTAVRAICDKVAAEAVGPDTQATDPYLTLDAAARDKALALVYMAILTPQQQAKIKPATQPTRSLD